MIVTMHQPHYLPYMGLVEKIRSADLYICTDTNLYSHQGYQNRNRIKTKDGLHWLTVPVIKNESTAISNIRIDNSKPWQRKHFRSLRVNYSRAPYFNRHLKFLEECYCSRDWELLLDLNLYTMDYLLRHLGVTTPSVLASGLRLNPAVYPNPTERILASVIRVGGDAYLSGPMGRNYLDAERFRQEGIDLVYQDAKIREWPQLWGKFEPLVSAIDFLFNCGE